MIYDCYMGKISLIPSDTKQAKRLIDTGRYIGEDEVLLCADVLKGIKNPVMIDAGANHGLFSYSLRCKLENLTVYAYEAQPEVFKYLKQTTELNRFKNYFPFNQAISDKPGVINVPVYDYTKTGSFGSVELLTQSKDVGQKPIGSTLVESIKIDDLNLDKVDFIKLDIEGMEIHALNGSLNTIKKHKPIMYIEYMKIGKNQLSDWFDKNIKDLYNFNYKKADVVCTPK